MLNNRFIRDWSNSVHRLKKNGTRITNPDNKNIEAIRYVMRIQIHLFFVILCRKIIVHSRARDIMNAAITMYIYDREIYII